MEVALDAPLADVEGAAGERARITATFARRPLGTFELPVCDGAVRADVIADAAADLLGWDLLRAFFEAELYPALRADPAAFLEGRLLAGVVSPEEAGTLDAAELHDRVGWDLFLQELWGSVEEPEAFYASGDRGQGVLPRVRSALRRRAWHRAEVSADLEPVRGPADVLVSVGGAALGIVPVHGAAALEPWALRGAINSVAGFELCRVTVREALIGRGAVEGGLRDRLARAAAERSRAQAGRERSRFAVPRGIEPAPAWDETSADVGGSARVLLARHGPDPADGAPDTIAGRRAAIPSETADEVLAAATAAQEPVVFLGEDDGARAEIRYVPELLWRPRRRTRLRSGRAAATESGPGRGEDAGIARRHRFEATFAEREDPWRYENEYERTKYEITLSLVLGRPERALEVGCAEGHFTELLAPKVGRLTATDISAIAVDRAARRCAGLDNVDFARIDLVSDPLPDGFDLVVCSETLYFTGERAGLEAAVRKLAEAVAPGGHLLTAHAHQVVDDPNTTGFDWGLPFGAKAIGYALGATGLLSLVREVRTPLYRVQLFRRTDGTGGAPAPHVTEIDQPAPVPEHVAPTVRWAGGPPAGSRADAEETTDRLPILVYHRVAPEGAASRFRITPAAFEKQLSYLRSAGFRSVGIGEWRTAMDARRPLPGRAVMLTFDDGYRDFAEHAWPLLRRHGFGAVLFAIAGEVGGSNRWSTREERVDLLDWPELLRLRDEGVELGSHSTRHRRLTELSPAEIVREAAGSRAELTRQLGEPPQAFAYPYGATDHVVQHLVGACGYNCGFGVDAARCRLQDRMLALPRIEVAGDDELPAFIAKLSA